MKNDTLKAIIIIGLILAILVGIFVASLDYFLNINYSVLPSILLSVLASMGLFAIAGAIYKGLWRIFTPEGREDAEIAQARYEIEKLERKRNREWKRMNR